MKLNDEARRDQFPKRKEKRLKTSSLFNFQTINTQLISILRIILSIQNISRFMIGLNPLGNSSTPASVGQIWKKFETSSKMTSIAQAIASKRHGVVVVGSVASVRK